MTDSAYNKNFPGILTIIFFFTVFLCFFNAGPASGRTKAADSEKNAPVHVVSDRMTATKKSSMVEFSGNVRATRLNAVINADSLKIFFAEKSDKKNKHPDNNIKKIIAQGHVIYTEGKKKAFADKAVYTLADEILVLTGKSARLTTGPSFVTGKKITLYNKQDKVVVQSDGKTRVEALFNPEDKAFENQQ